MAIETYPDSISVKTAIQTRMVDDLGELFTAVNNLTAGNVTWLFTDKTSDYTIDADDDCYGTQIFTNNAASGTVNFSLPAGVTGLRVNFVVMTSQTLKVTANGTETIRYIGTQTAGGGYVQSSTVGTFWTMAWNDTEWVVTNLEGELEHAAGILNSSGSDAFAFFMGG